MPLSRLRWVLLLCLLATMRVIYANTEESNEPRLDVPYEPTPHDVVAAMLQLAGVTPEDVLYDLGCGDGRIVIAAFQQFGARAIGVDLDPQRIRDSVANARQAGVERRVQFLQQDLFATDLRDATVVTLFLWPEVNLQLRPTLLRDLRPGTRVVSHAHDMDDWPPDRTAQQRNRTLYLWIIPAQVAGTWTWTPAGTTEPSTLQLTQRFQQVQGTLRAQGMAISLKDVHLVGDRLRFTVVLPEGQGPQVTQQFDGHIQGNTLEGHVTPPGASGTPQPWVAQRTIAY